MNVVLKGNNMSIRAIGFPSIAAATGMRFHTNSVNGAKPPAFYRSYIHSVGTASQTAAKFSSLMVADASLASLTPEQMETVRELNRKAQELLKASQAVKALIPSDTSFEEAFSPLMSGPNIPSNQGGFAQGYATAKLEQAIGEGVATSFEANANIGEAAETLTSAAPALEAASGILEVLSRIFGGSE